MEDGLPASVRHRLVFCQKHEKETRVEKVAAGVTFLACGCTGVEE